MSRSTIFALVGGVLVLAFVMATLIYRNQQASTSSTAPTQERLSTERMGAPIKGPQDARVTIVEFFDPACETCRDFHPLLEQLIAQYPGKVRLMVRYAPLHPGSDQVVMMLEAAHRQGQFWPALERLFSQQQRWTINHHADPRKARQSLMLLNLDQEQMNADARDQEVLQVIRQDMSDFKRLNVKATPEFFVNGRPLPSWGYEQLKQVVAEEVAASY